MVRVVYTLTNRLHCTLYLQWGDHDGVLVCYGDYQVDQTLVVKPCGDRNTSSPDVM